jgi:PKD repeat protein
MGLWADGLWAPGLWAPGLWATDETSAAPTITTTTLDSLRVGIAFSQQLAATGDTPITWAGTPPAGLTLSSAGLLSGTPTTEGAYSFTVTATNAEGSDEQLYAGNVEQPGTGGLVLTYRRRQRRR